MGSGALSQTQELGSQLADTEGRHRALKVQGWCSREEGLRRRQAPQEAACFVLILQRRLYSV